MNDEGDKKQAVHSHKAMGFTLPIIGQVVTTLDENGEANVKVENPAFADTPYSVLLGLSLQKGGPICYGTLKSLKQGDHFYARVQPKAPSFDILLKAQDFPNQKVTMQFCAISHDFVGPTNPPTPTPFFKALIGLRGIGFRLEDYPDRYVNELTGIDPKLIQRMIDNEIKNLATLASASVEHIAQILSISEVRAMGFIYEARALLTNTKIRQ
ncbi:MAG: helix-hairpin-helix domain-containing protein [Phycisphaerae bacterium]|nr:helix-hairpin-helix domain-containing protein [Phycisphaerae bacterium]